MLRPGGVYLLLPHGECFTEKTQGPPCLSANPKEGVTQLNYATGPDFDAYGGEGLEQLAPLALLRLDVGVIGHRPRGQGGLVVGHSIQHEPVDAVVGPAIPAAQGLEHHQGQPVVVGHEPSSGRVVNRLLMA